jgi:hypothetical protein
MKKYKQLDESLWRNLNTILYYQTKNHLGGTFYTWLRTHTDEQIMALSWQQLGFNVTMKIKDHNEET